MISAGDPAQSHKRGILIGATLAVFGVGLSLDAEQGLGGWLTVIGVLVAAFSLHKLGRSGAS